MMVAEDEPVVHDQARDNRYAPIVMPGTFMVAGGTATTRATSTARDTATGTDQYRESGAREMPL